MASSSGKDGEVLRGEGAVRTDVDDDAAAAVFLRLSELEATGGMTRGSVFTMIAVALTMKKISSRKTMSIIGDMSNCTRILSFGGGCAEFGCGHGLVKLCLRWTVLFRNLHAAPPVRNGLFGDAFGNLGVEGVGIDRGHRRVEHFLAGVHGVRHEVILAKRFFRM